MSVTSPTLESFRVAFRRPSLTFAEIAWRWTVGAASAGLFFFWLFEFLGTLPVSNSDALLLATKHPVLVGQAIAHILRGSLSRAVFSGLIGVMALTLLWIVGASVGRAVTVRALLGHFRKDIGYLAAAPRSLLSLLGLNFLRAAVTLAAILGVVGAAILATFASPKASPHPGLAFILFLPFACLVCGAWSILNWLLSLAGMFAVRNGEEVLGSLSAAVTFFRKHTGAVFAVSTWTGLAHLTALSVAGTAISFPLALLPVAPGRLVIAGLVLVALIYFAVVDWLYIARLAGYVYIAEMPDDVPQPAPSAAPPPETSIDREELILSDLPNLALET